MNFWEIEGDLQPILVRKEYVGITTTLAAALLLSQIVYWFKPAKNGKRKLSIVRGGRYWLAKSAEQWAEEVGLSTKQCRTALKELQEALLVEVEVRRFGGAPMSHIWLNEGALLQSIAFRFPPSDLPSGSIPICPTGQVHLPSGASPFDLQGKSYTETTTATTNIDCSVNGKPIPVLGQEVQVQEGHLENMELKPIKFAGKTALEVLAKVKQGSKTSDTDSLPILWKKEYAGIYGQCFATMTKADQGKLGRIAKAVGLDTAKDILKFTVRDWQKFGDRVKEQKGLGGYPLRPAIGFLLQHYDVAQEMMVKVPALAPSHQAPVAAKVPKPSQPLPQTTTSAPATPQAPSEAPAQPFQLEGEALAAHFKELGL